jgi:hypothetical protein
MAKNNLDTLEKIPGDTPEAKYDNICKMKEILCEIGYREEILCRMKEILCKIGYKEEILCKIGYKEDFTTTTHEFAELIQENFSFKDLS